MSKDDKDSSDALAELFATLVVAAIGLAIGAIVAGYVQWKNTVRLPNTLEPPDKTEPPLAFLNLVGLHIFALLQLIFVPKQWEIFQAKHRVMRIVLGIIYGFITIALLLQTRYISDTLLLLFVSFAIIPVMLYVIEAGFAYSQGRIPEATKEDDTPPVKPLDVSTARAYTVYPSRSSDWVPERDYRFMEQILHRFPRLTFQVIAEKGRILWRIVDLRQELEPSLITQAIHTIYPDADVQEAPLTIRVFEPPLYRFVLRFKQASEFIGPIQYVTNLKNYDPLVAISQEMSGLQEGEQIVYTLFVAGFADFAQREGEKLITKPAFHPLQFMSVAGWVDYGIKSATKQDMQEKYQATDQRVFREKLNSPIYQCLLLVEATAPTRERLGKLLIGFDSSIWQFTNQPYNALVWQGESAPSELPCLDDEADIWKQSTLGLLNAWLTNERQDWQPIRLLLEPRELASLWHLPYKSFSAPEIIWGQGQRVPAPTSVSSNEEGTLIGYNIYAGHHSPVYLPENDRDTHMNIVGKTRVGKSTLMHILIHQDIAEGRGVAVVDPHGKLISDIIRRSIPEHRIDDVVIIDIANEAFPPPLNPLILPQGTGQRIAAGRFLSVLERVYGSFSERHRMVDTLNAALTTLWQQDQTTIRDITRLFEDEDYRDSLLQGLDDIEAEEFWARYERQSAGQQEQLSYPVIHRMRTFYGNPVLYPMLCHPDTLDFAQLIEEQKILLISLRADEDKIPPREQQLIGAVVVSQIQMAAMKSYKHRPPFYLYIDEAQDFVTTSLPEVFSEASKFGLRLIIANQYLRQLAGDTLDALMGNVGMSVIFQIGPDDARSLAPHLRPEFSVEDLLNLNLHHAVVKMRLHGHTQPAFSIETLKPLDEPENGNEREQHLRQRSIQLYTPKTRQEVITWLRNRYPRADYSSLRVKPKSQDELPPAFEPSDN